MSVASLVVGFELHLIFLVSNYIYGKEQYQVINSNLGSGANITMQDSLTLNRIIITVMDSAYVLRVLRDYVVVNV